MTNSPHTVWGMGVIGAGLIGKVHARAITCLPNARLTAVCDAVEERARTLAGDSGARVYTRYEDMLKDDAVDVVTIATPSGLHKEPTVAAAKAGKSVLCEKPLEIDLERTDAMIAAHASSRTQLGAILPLRFDDLYEPLRDAVRSGRFGRITSATVHVPWWRDEAYYKNSWRGTWKMDGGGAVMNQSIHLMDLLCWFMPPVETIQALTATLAHEDMETEDTAVAICRFQGGALGMIEGSTSAYPGRPTRIEIAGSRGTAVVQSDGVAFWKFDDERPGDEKIRQSRQRMEETGGHSDPGGISHLRHQRNFAAFLKALDEGREFELCGREARKSIAMIMALYDAAKTGRPAVCR